MATRFNELAATSSVSAPVVQYSPQSTLPASQPKGATAYSDTDNTLYTNDGTQWVKVGGGFNTLAETNEGFVEQSAAVVDLDYYETLFVGTTRLVTNATELNNALAASVDGDIIRLNNSFTSAVTLTFPAKSLLIDFQNFTITCDQANVTAFNVNTNGKILVMRRGTFAYLSNNGITDSHVFLAMGTNAVLWCNQMTFKYGEFAITAGDAGLTTNNIEIVCQQCTFEYQGQSTRATNNYAAILCSGMSSSSSYISVVRSTFSSSNAIGSENARLIRLGTNVIRAGSVLVSECTISTAHRVQAVVYYELPFLANKPRGTHRCIVVRNNLTNAGARNQLVLVIGANLQYEVLNMFDGIYMLENTVARLDDDKGICYIDTVTATPGNAFMQANAGSTNVHVYENTLPALPAAGPTRVVISKDGTVRGSSVITSVYLQKLVA